MKKFAPLYHKTKNGAIIEWNISVKGSKITTTWGQIGGKIQTSELICEAKNEGRANATTSEEQAIKEAEAMWKYQVELKYRESIEEAEEVQILPMLARSKSITKDENIDFPCHIQPKFDGVRCMAMWDGDDIILMSRNGKSYNVPHIADELRKMLPKETILDGELYVHGVGFQTVSSLVKRVQPETSKVCYRVYDCPMNKGVTGRMWQDRYEDLKKIVSNGTTRISVCETKEVHNMEEVFEYQGECIADGYEGAILRTLDGKYLFGHRSRSELLKVKNFIDDEFEIVNFCGGKKGTKEENAIMFTCKIKNGSTFNVRPKGKIADREEMFKNGKKYIGKMYTVKFFEYSDEGIPRFPVGLGIHEDR